MTFFLWQPFLQNFFYITSPFLNLPRNCREERRPFWARSRRPALEHRQEGGQGLPLLPG
jgi:hypothetical protein